MPHTVPRNQTLPCIVLNDSSLVIFFSKMYFKQVNLHIIYINYT